MYSPSGTNNPLHVPPPPNRAARVNDDDLLDDDEGVFSEGMSSDENLYAGARREQRIAGNGSSGPLAGRHDAGPPEEDSAASMLGLTDNVGSGVNATLTATRKGAAMVGDAIGYAHAYATKAIGMGIGREAPASRSTSNTTTSSVATTNQLSSDADADVDVDADDGGDGNGNGKFDDVWSDSHEREGGDDADQQREEEEDEEQDGPSAADLEEIESILDALVRHDEKPPQMSRRQEMVDALTALNGVDAGSRMGNVHHQVDLQAGKRYYMVESEWHSKFMHFLGIDESDSDGDSKEIDEDSDSDSDERADQKAEARTRGVSESKVARPWPGPVDNDDLINSRGVVFSDAHCHQDRHFVLVTEAKWRLLCDWFGGGPELMRVAYNDEGHFVYHQEGITLRVLRSSAPSKYISVNVSKYSTVGDLRRLMCERFGLVPSRVRVWDYYENKRFELMHNITRALGDQRLLDNQLIMLEEANEDGEFEWPVEEIPMSSGHTLSGAGSTMLGDEGLSDVWGEGMNSASGSSHSLVKNTVTRQFERTPVADGLVGLVNLGNTCFMNSILQCLSNAEGLRRYFLSDAYKPDRNTSNPLGMNGKLADTFASLLKLMWSDRSERIAEVCPRAFKTAIAQFKPDFAGYQQHDSQELLSFLLDGLHEDLNRVINKPYVENVEANGRPDEVVAKESWEAHKLRNDSAINDMFTGLFKSTVVCPEKSCAHTSVTFDTFMCAQLPLQSGPKLTVEITVTVHDPNDWSARRRVTVSVPKDGGVAHVRLALSEQLTASPTFPSSSPSSMARPNAYEPGGPIAMRDVLIAEIWGFKIHKIFVDTEEAAQLTSPIRLAAFIDPAAETALRVLGLPPIRWTRIPAPPPTAAVAATAAAEAAAATKERFGSIPAVRCPFLVGDLWTGAYGYSRTERSMRFEILKVHGPFLANQDDGDGDGDGDGDSDVRLFSYDVAAVFDFRQERHTAPWPQGSFTVRGTFVTNEARSAQGRGKFSFEPGNWVDDHFTAETTGIGGDGDVVVDGTCLIGTIDHPACGPFSLTRVDDPVQLASMRSAEPIPKRQLKPPKPPTLVQIAHQRVLPRNANAAFSYKPPSSFFGMPTAFSVDADTTERQFHALVLDKLYDLVQVDRKATAASRAAAGVTDSNKDDKEEGEEEEEDDPLGLCNHFDLVFASESFGVENRNSFYSNSRPKTGVIVDSSSNRLLTAPVDAESVADAPQNSADSASSDVDEDGQGDVDNGDGVEYFVLYWDWVGLARTPGTVFQQRMLRREQKQAQEDAESGDGDDGDESDDGERGQGDNSDKDKNKEGDHEASSLTEQQQQKKKNRGAHTRKYMLTHALFGRKSKRSRRMQQRHLLPDPNNPGQESDSDDDPDDDDKDGENGESAAELTVDHCLDLFTKEEQLSSTDTWYCPKCKEHREAFKRMEFWSLPDLLVLQLKRFSQDSHHSFTEKLETNVAFPLEGLDLNARCSNPSDDTDYTYDLFAVSNHFGGLGGGHYTAFARNSETDRWYEFDDSRVSPVGANPKNEIQTSAAYVLFYKRRGVRFDQFDVAAGADQVQDGDNNDDEDESPANPVGEPQDERSRSASYSSIA